MITPSQTFARRFRELRLFRDLTQEQVAKCIGVQKYRVSEVERELSDIRIETIDQFCRALHVLPHEVMADKFDPEARKFSVLKEPLIHVIQRNVRAARESKGMTLTEIGELIGTQHSFVCRIELQDYGFRVSTIDRVAKAIGVSLSDVMNPAYSPT